jgi:hypothetical protein
MACCELYLPDGYSSVSDDGSGGPVFTEHVGICKCAKGGGDDASDCGKIYNIGGNAFPKLLETFEHDGTAGEYALPAFFCTQDGAQFYYDPEYEAGESETALNSACLEPSHKIGLMGAFARLPGSLGTGVGDYATRYGGGPESLVYIRQQDIEDQPYAYVTASYWLRILEIGDLPAIAGGGAGSAGDLSTWFPGWFTVTYRKQMPGCGCFPTGVFTYYSSSFDSVSSPPGGNNCRCSKGWGTDVWSEECHCCEPTIFQGNCPCPDWEENGEESELCGGPNGWFNITDCYEHYWDEQYTCDDDGDSSNDPEHVFMTHCENFGGIGGDACTTEESYYYKTLSCVSGCYNSRKCSGLGSAWAGISAPAYQLGCDPCGYNAAGLLGTCDQSGFVTSVPTDSDDFDNGTFSIGSGGTCTVSNI